MQVCKNCGRECVTVIFKPVAPRPDGTMELDGPLCRVCAAPPPSTTSTSFVKGGGSASDYRPPAGPVVKKNLY